MGRLPVTAGDPPGLSLAGYGHTGDDYAQMPRLNRFRDEHPHVIIGDGGFGTWQARIPEPAGEIVITRHLLREVLDRLDELLPPDSG